MDAGAIGDAERLLLPEPQVDDARTARIGGSVLPPSLLRGAQRRAGRGRHRRRLRRGHARAGADRAGRPGLRAGRAGTARARPARPPAPASTCPRIGRPPSACGAPRGRWRSARSDARAIELRVVHAWPAPPLDDSGRTTRSRQCHVPERAGRRRWPPAASPAASRPTRREADAIPARRWLRGRHRRSAGADRALRDRPRRRASRRSSPASRTAWASIGSSISPGRASAGIATTSKACACCCARPAPARRWWRRCGRSTRIGRAVRFSWPSEIDVHDDRLQRVSEADPGAWWGSTRRQVVWL